MADLLAEKLELLEELGWNFQKSTHNHVMEHE
jgi:hypothetical protein